MSRFTIYRAITGLFAIVLAFTALGTSAASTNGIQQATAIGTATPGGTGDDSDQLPIYINISGIVQTITATSITISGQTILIPPGMQLPSGVQVGQPASLRGNLRDDDSIVIILIVAGYHLPTPTPGPTGTPAPTAASTAVSTALPTVSATLAATQSGTQEPEGTAEPGCDKPGQKLAVLISTAYAVPYSQIVKLHCEGYHFGVIARAILIVIAGGDEGKNFTVGDVLGRRGEGDDWNAIIIIFGVQPDSTIVILVIDGGQVSFFTDCGAAGQAKKKSKFCVQSTGGGGGQGGGGQGGGKHGEGGDED